MIAASARQIKLSVWGLVAGLIALTFVAALSLVWSVRQSTIADGQAQATRFIAGAEAALNRSLLAIDVLLAGTDELLGLSNLAQQWIDAKAASQLLRNAARQNLSVRFVALVNENGRVVASSEFSGADLDVNLPPGFLADAMAQPMSTLVVSEPVVSFASSERVLFIGRYVRLADGSRLLSVAEVPTSMLATVLMQGSDIEGLEVTLERGRGQLLLGIPVLDDRLPNGLIQPAMADFQPMAGAEQVSRLTGVPALVVGRPVLYRDLWISASVPVETV